MSGNDTDGGLSRRELLKRAGIGGAALLGGSLLGAAAGGEATAAPPPDVYGGGGHGQMTVGEDVLSSRRLPGRHGLRADVP